MGQIMGLEIILPSPETVKTAAEGVDILLKLWNTFKPSHETAMKLQECEDKMKQFGFKKINEDFHFKAKRGFSIKKFQDFVARMQNTFGLSEKEVQSLLDGLDTDENKNILESSEFEDGKGKIYRGRFITAYKDQKIDVAYAIYTVDFELPEKVSDLFTRFWCWLFGYKAEAQALTSDQKDKLNEWCEAKMHHVAQKQLKESKTTNGN